MCRQLGLAGGVALTDGDFGRGSGPIWLDEGRCSGTEVQLEACPHDGWGNNDCGHNEDAGVRCKESLMPTSWEKQSRVHCNDNKFPTSYSSLQSAQTACIDVYGENCAGVYDKDCDGTASFYSCQTGVFESSSASCIYVPNGRTGNSGGQCSGEATLTTPSGSISDGPGSYSSSQSCAWTIGTGSPITLTFSSF